MNNALIIRRLPLIAFSMLGSSLDILLFFLFVLVRNWDSIKQNVGLYINSTVVTDCIKCLLLLLILLQSIRYIRGLQHQQQRSMVENGIPKPMLFPCGTSHTRLFPKKHTFSYSYLLAGVPIGWKGSVGGFLSADVEKKSESWFSRLFSTKPQQGNTWYTVDPADYLEPGHVHLGLEGKLERYLQSQGARRRDYPYVYLVTAPKFMGYVSNPISLWCMYSAKKELTAMILEVNNTFNERRMYFVKAEDLVNTCTADKLEFDWQNLEKAAYEFDSAQQSERPKAAAKFIKRWAKDFYVSPLNSRKGSYSLIAYDPFFPAMTGCGPLNVTVTLNSNNDHAKLVARVFSTGPALDPSNMSVWEKTKFLVAWWWVSFATFFPRTVYQAGVLVVKRKLQFLSRPEPLKGTISRPADGTEKMIESVFRDYLRHLVESTGAPVVVKYIPAGIPEASEEVMVSPAAQIVPERVEELELKILTPLFYSRFVHYHDDLDAFHHEFYQSRTIWLSNPLVLLDFVPDHLPSLSHQIGFAKWESACFKAIQKLRIRPAPIGGPTTAKDAKRSEVPPVPMREFAKDNQYTGLEAFIITETDPTERASYMKKVFKLFISDHIALGSLELLGLELFLLRCLVAWMLTMSSILDTPIWGARMQ